jgi:hypothetical protein
MARGLLRKRNTWRLLSLGGSERFKKLPANLFKYGDGTKILIVSVIIILAVAGGLLVGGVVSGGFFTAFSSPHGGADDAAGSADDGASPGFNIKMGTKTGGTVDSDAQESDGEEETAAETEAANETAAVQALPASTPGPGSHPGGPSNDDDTNEEVACTADSDCDAGVYYNFCSGKSVMTAYGTNTCKSPGTASSSCSYNENKETAVVNRTCTYGCDGGSCVTGVYISPSSINVANGSEFTVDVMISTDELIYAGDFRIGYDAASLSMKNITMGDFFEVPVGAPMDKSESGLIYYIITKQATNDGSTGTRKAFTVAFTVLAASGSNVEIKMEHIELIGVIDNKLNPTNSTSVGGVVNVQ